MTSKQAHVETQGFSLVPFMDSPSVGPRSGGQRLATMADVYGPFREDSMELKEEKAYQRGMLEHIRESTQALELYPGGNYSSQRGETFGTQSTDAVGQPRHVTVWDDLSTVYRPKPTYYELGQKVSTRPIPPPPRTYTKFFSTTPRAYPETLSRDTEESSRVYYPTAPPTLLGGWTKHHNPHPSIPEEFSDLHQPYTSRGPPLPLPPPPPILLPLLGTGQPPHGYGGGYYGSGYYSNGVAVGNEDPRKLSVDVNVNMSQVEPGHREGQRSSGGQVLRPYVPPLALNQPKAIPQLNQVTSAPTGSSHHLPFNRQPWTDRPTGEEPIYPYRSMKNPWFPKPDKIPPLLPLTPPQSVRHHFRRGKYGYYRVFDVNDYKKLQKELRLGSLVGEEKDFETIEDKKEKKAILSEYGRLIRAKNREEMNPNYSYV